MTGQSLESQVIELGFQNQRKKRRKMTATIMTPSTAMNSAMQNSFRNSFLNNIDFTQLCKFLGGANFEKHADLGKKNRNRWKSRENSLNTATLMEKASISLRTGLRRVRKQFVPIPSNGFTMLRGC